MSTTGPGIRAILRINVQIIFGIVLAFAAWWMWNHMSAIWWQLGVLSVICGVGSFSILIEALSEVRRYILRDYKVWAYKKKGATPKSDRLVSSKKLRDEGLIK